MIYLIIWIFNPIRPGGQLSARIILILRLLFFLVGNVFFYHLTFIVASASNFIKIYCFEICKLFNMSFLDQKPFFIKTNLNQNLLLLFFA